MTELPYWQSTQQTMSSYKTANAVMFFVDLSTYDQLPSSDETATSLQEALVLFETLFNAPEFVKATFILFLNKVDIFKEKFQVSAMNRQFPDYSGGDDFREALHYILNQFTNLGHDGTKQVYAHITCCVDIMQIRYVVAAVNGELFFASYTLSCLTHLPDLVHTHFYRPYHGGGL